VTLSVLLARKSSGIIVPEIADIPLLPVLLLDEQQCD